MYIQQLWLRLKCLFVLTNDLNTSKINQGQIQRYCGVIGFTNVDIFQKTKPLELKCVDMLLKIARSTYWLHSKQNLCVSYKYVQFVICHKSTLRMPTSKVSVVCTPKVDINKHELSIGLSSFTHQLSKQKFHIF